MVSEGPVISPSSGQSVLDENSQTDKIGQNDTDFQNIYNSSILALENIGHDAREEPSKSTDSALEKGGSKARKAGGKKSKSKSTLALPAPSIETQPNPSFKEEYKQYGCIV